MKKLVMTPIKSITLTATPQKICDLVLGNRDSLHFQAQGDDRIAIYFSESDITNDNYYVINAFEWLWLNEDRIANGVWVKSLGADQKMVYQINNPKK